MSLFGNSEMKIYSITIDKPRIHAIVNKEGEANWDITKPDTSSSQKGESNFKLSLNKYAINDAYISYFRYSRKYEQRNIPSQSFRKW